MRKLILILLLPLLIFGQSDNQSQSIELPDFVITGRQKVDLPVMKKSKAKPVSILSKEYFFPAFTPEQFTLATVAKPQQIIADLHLNETAYNKQLIIGAGQYTLPTGYFYFAQPFSVGKFYSNLWGTNQKDYVDYSDFNVSGINLGSNFYINRNSEFLPGSIINFDAQYLRNEYNFYSPFRPSNTEPVKRETNNFSGSLSLRNYYGDSFKYNFKFGGNQIDIKDTDTQEMNLYFAGNTKLLFGDFGLLLSGKFHNQSVSKSTTDDDYNFIAAKGGIEYSLNRNFIVRGGITYYSVDVKRFLNSNAAFAVVTEDSFAPWAEAEFLFNNNLSLTASFNQEIEFNTYSDLLKVNRYTYINNPLRPELGFDNTTTIYNNKLDVVLTYAYKKYYELSFGGAYFSADDYSFFDSDFSFDNIPRHMDKFYIDRIDDVKGYSLYANALYHLGPFGWFYGDAKYEVTETDNNNNIPYHPKLSLEAAYGYQFGFGLSAELKLHYLQDTYADLENSILLDDYINLSAELRFSLTQNFEITLHLNNLLNRDNYFWLGYIEPPFDFTAGIDFRF